MSKGLKVLLTTVVLTTAFVGLMWATMRGGTEYYLKVEEVLVEPAAWQGKRLQVHGYASNVLRTRNSLDWRFDITEAVGSAGHVVHAEYNGLVPDTFDNHAEVVVSGVLEGDTLIVDARGIMAKCPSKYEAAPGFEGGLVGGPAPAEADGASN
jgi:cytochrome c-type biogenesis protein CcmE